MGIERIIGPLQTPLLMPVEAVAARLAGAAPAALYTAAALWAKEVRTAAQVFGCRTALIGGVPWVAAEALGGVVDWQRETVLLPSGSPTYARTARWTAFLEALEQLLADRMAGPVVALVPGGALLVRSLSMDHGDSALTALKLALVKLVEDVGKARPDAIVLVEDTALGPGELSPEYRRLVSTLHNITRYFDVPLGLSVGTADAGKLDALARLRPEALLLTADASGELAEVETVRRLASSVQLVGLPVLLTDPLVASERVQSGRLSLKAGTWCVCSARELPANTELAAVRALVAQMGTV